MENGGQRRPPFVKHSSSSRNGSRNSRAAHLWTDGFNIRHLGAYEVTAKIGEGGMGEAWQVHNTFGE